MSQQQRSGLTHAFTLTLKTLSAATLALSLGACTELARFVSKPEAKSNDAATEESATAPVVEAKIENPVKPKPSKLYEWNGDGRPVSRIVIDTDTQRAHFFAGEDEVGWSTVASGLPKHPTPTGQFAVIEKVENKRSNLYGKVVKGDKVIKSNAKSGRDPVPAGARFEGAHMPYFMRLTNDGIGLHAGPIPRPGQPASHGCIRLPSNLAPVLFQHVSHGVPVTIVGSGPSYGNYIQKQRVAEAQRVAREAEQRRAAEQKAAQEAAAGVVATTGGTEASPNAQSNANPSDEWVDLSVPTLSTPPQSQPEMAYPAVEPGGGAVPASIPAVAIVPTATQDIPVVSEAETTAVATLPTAPSVTPNPSYQVPTPTQAAPSVTAPVVAATPALPDAPRPAETAAAAPPVAEPVSEPVPVAAPASLPTPASAAEATTPQPASAPPAAATPATAEPNPIAIPPQPATQPAPEPAQALQPPAADPAGSEG